MEIDFREWRDFFQGMMVECLELLWPLTVNRKIIADEI